MLLLAKNYEPDKHNIENWWASEKLDGMRAYWNGKLLLTRNNNIIYAPDWFTKDFPKVELDGELFIGRGQFNKTESVVKKLNPIDDEWALVKYLIFDIPSSINSIFEDRIAQLYDLKLPNHVEIVEHFQVIDHYDVMKICEKLWDNKGEGLMLRQPKSLYERKRSSTLLKVKNILDDIATIIELIPGKGKHTGRLGAIMVEWNGIQFKIGTGFSDAQREQSYNIGDQVRFHYTELNEYGKPRFARFVSLYDE